MHGKQPPDPSNAKDDGESMEQEPPLTPDKNTTTKSNRNNNLTILFTKIKSTFLNKPGDLADAIAKIAHITTKQIRTINFTSAQNCQVEFLDPESFNKAKTIEASHLTDNGTNTPIITYDQNNFVLVRGTCKVEIEENHDAKDVFQSKGIMFYEDVKSNVFNRKTNLVKAYCSSKEAKEQLIKEGTVLFNYTSHPVSDFVKKPRVIICFECAEFGHVADRCKSQAKKCFKCSLAHSASECPIKGEYKCQGYKCPKCSGAHPLSYGGCEAMKTEIQRLNSRIHRQPLENIQRVHPTTSTFSYSNRLIKARPEMATIEVFNENITTQFRKLNERLDKIDERLSNLEQDLHKKIEMNTTAIAQQATEITKCKEHSSKVFGRLNLTFDFMIRQLLQVNLSSKTKGQSEQSQLYKEIQAFFKISKEEMDQRLANLNNGNTKSTNQNGAN